MNQIIHVHAKNVTYKPLTNGRKKFLIFCYQHGFELLFVGNFLAKGVLHDYIFFNVTNFGQTEDMLYFFNVLLGANKCSITLTSIALYEPFLTDVAFRLPVDTYIQHESCNAMHIYICIYI